MALFGKKKESIPVPQPVPQPTHQSQIDDLTDQINDLYAKCTSMQKQINKLQGKLLGGDPAKIEKDSIETDKYVLYPNGTFKAK